MASFVNVLDHIDAGKAGELIDAVCKEEVASGRGETQLHEFLDRITGGAERFSVMKNGLPSYHRLHQTTVEGDVEEVVVTLAGMVVESDLPPILFPLKNTLGKRPRYARRGVHITGFGSATFQQAMQALIHIYDLLKTSGTGTVEGFATPTFRGYPMIATANNYFTLKSLMPYETFKPFSNAEDPFDVLNNFAAMSKEDLVRVEDNDIQLFQKVIKFDREGVATSKIIPDATLVVHVGDIVQVQMTFAMFKLNGPNQKGNYCVRHILRSVALMDTTLRKDAIEKALKLTTHLWGPPLKVKKRSVGYENEKSEGEEDEPSAKAPRLCITSE